MDRGNTALDIGLTGQAWQLLNGSQLTTLENRRSQFFAQGSERWITDILHGSQQKGELSEFYI